jgi:Uma2 family endonuclease
LGTVTVGRIRKGLQSKNEILAEINMATATVQPAVEAFPYPPTNLPEEDGVPLESDWHRLAMSLLIELVSLHLKGRDDFFVGGNMFIYFDARQARDRNFRGPDFFFVWDAPLNPPRRYWAVWDEGGKYPDVIIELSSPTTADQDHGIKKLTYERVFHTSEYFIYDPDSRELRGWRLNDQQRYQEIPPNENGWLWCEQLGFWLGTWTGSYLGKQEVYLRFYDKAGNLVPSAADREEAEKQRAETEKQRAEAEKQRAEVEKQRAEAEKQRADAAEAELARLKAQAKKPAP